MGRLDAHCAGHLVKGFFPAPNSRVHARDLDPHEWLQAFLVTYAERDARQLAAIQDLGAFQRFKARCNAGLRKPLHVWRGHFSAIHPALVYGGETRFTREGVDVMP